MKISLKWIEDYTPITLSPDELKERLSVSLTEVSSSSNFADAYRGILVAEVTAVKKHAEAEGLLVLSVNDGGGTKQVVVQKCPVKKGDKVAYFPVGMSYDAGNGETIKISKKKIKGVESEGFIPSGRELGLNYDHTTVFTLSDTAEIGEELVKVLDLDDQILEIKNKSLTHRPDAFSEIGLAREISAIQKSNLELPRWYTNPEKEVGGNPGKLKLKVENKAEALCRRYMAVIIDNVKVGQSPLWMQVRLSKLGVRPVNNVVDVSNYLMLEAGQPNHCFDYDKVVSKDPNFKDEAVIKVRLARGGEQITTLDGQQKELFADTIVISDSESPIGVAGVMGGKDTEISETTKRVIFQVENLDMYSIRRTSMKLGIFSDAVTRFSKGLDPNLCEPVFYRGVQLIKELAGGEVASEIVDNYIQPIKSHFVTIYPKQVIETLGVEISVDAMADCLTRLGIGVKNESYDSLVLTVPTFRPDLKIAEDINEEIIRLYGYDKVKPSLPARTIAPTRSNVSRDFRLKIKQLLKETGGNEVYTYSFVGKSLYDKLGLDVNGLHKLKNALSPELGYLRDLLVPNLLEKVPQNLKLHDEIALFEIDQVNPARRRKTSETELPDEPWHLGLVHNKSYYHAKQYLDRLVLDLGVREYCLKNPAKATVKNLPEWIGKTSGMFAANRYAYVLIGDVPVGVVGELASSVVSEMDLSVGTALFELDLNALEPLTHVKSSYFEPSKYPAVVHDLCFVLNSGVQYDAVYSAILSADCQVVKQIECKDIYMNMKSGNEKKMTFRVTIQSDDHTLTAKEIELIRKKTEKSVSKSTGGKLCA